MKGLEEMAKEILTHPDSAPLLQSPDFIRGIRAMIGEHTEDPVVNRVLRSFIERHEAGMLRYGVTMEANALSTLQWITHAQEEAMDFILYLERLKSDFEAAEDLSRQPDNPFEEFSQACYAEPSEQPDSGYRDYMDRPTEKVWDGPELKQRLFP